jgi:hypothetical protein
MGIPTDKTISYLVFKTEISLDSVSYSLTKPSNFLLSFAHFANSSKSRR